LIHFYKRHFQILSCFCFNRKLNNLKMFGRGPGPRDMRQCRSPSPGVNFTPLGQQHRVADHDGGVRGVGPGSYLPTQTGPAWGQGVAFQTGLGSQQQWPRSLPRGLGLGRGGEFGSLLPPGGGGFSGGVSQHGGVSQYGGVSRAERFWDGGQEFRLIREVVSPSKTKGVDGRRNETIFDVGRIPIDSRSVRSNSKGISEHRFGDNIRSDSSIKGIEKHDRTNKTRGSGTSRGRSSSRSKKKPRSGKRARRGSSTRSSSRETHSSKRYKVSGLKECGDNGKEVNKFNERVFREEKRLAEKRKYEEDRLKQVKRREERIAQDEKRLKEQQRLEDIKREERKVKQLEKERLKREKDLYIREEELMKLKYKRNFRERRGRSTQSRSPSVLGHRWRSRSRRVIRHSSNSSSSGVRQSSMNSNQKYGDNKRSDNGKKPASLSPDKPRGRSVRRSPSVSVSRSVLDRIGPVVSVKTRLGTVTSRRGVCRYCGESHHGNEKNRKLHCKAFGKICKTCGRRNHVAKMCRQATIVCISSDVERDDSNNNSDERWNTIDEVGFTDVPANDDDINHEIKGQVDLDKIIIKKRNK